MYPDTGGCGLGTRTEVDDAFEQHAVRGIELGEIDAAGNGPAIGGGAVPLEGGIATHDIGRERTTVAAGPEKRSVRASRNESPHHVTEDVQNVEFYLARIREVEPD